MHDGSQEPISGKVSFAQSERNNYSVLYNNFRSYRIIQYLIYIPFLNILIILCSKLYITISYIKFRVYGKATIATYNRLQSCWDSDNTTQANLVQHRPPLQQTASTVGQKPVCNRLPVVSRQNLLPLLGHNVPENLTKS